MFVFSEGAAANRALVTTAAPCTAATGLVTAGAFATAVVTALDRAPASLSVLGSADTIADTPAVTAAAA